MLEREQAKEIVAKILRDDWNTEMDDDAEIGAFESQAEHIVDALDAASYGRELAPRASR